MRAPDASGVCRRDPRDLDRVEGKHGPVREVAQLVCDVVGFEGAIVCDTSKPDGTPRKLMAADKLRGMGWAPSTPLREGIAKAYAWFLENEA